MELSGTLARMGGEASILHSCSNHVGRERLGAVEPSWCASGGDACTVQRSSPADAGAMDLVLVYLETLATLRSGSEISRLANRPSFHNRIHGSGCAGGWAHRRFFFSMENMCGACFA